MFEIGLHDRALFSFPTMHVGRMPVELPEALLDLVAHDPLQVGKEFDFDLVVIAPDFTHDSEAQARLHEVQTGNKLALITAAELKDIAVKWTSSKKADDAFPLRFLTTTGRFDPSILEAVL